MVVPGVMDPWSKKHKAVTRVGQGGTRHSLSNSFAQPTSQAELVEITLARGDRELVEQFNTHALTYTPNGGSLDLRKAIASLYGPAIGADNILVFTGAQVALQTAAFALAAGCHSITFSPGYQSCVEAPIHAGGQVTVIELKADNGWQIDIQQVRAAIRANTRYMVINSPYNPAGTLMSHQLQSELIALAEEHDITVLSDEVYRLLEHDIQHRLPAMADAYAKGLSLVTLSKPWGGCGITIGWIATQDAAIRHRLVDVQYFGTACPSRASELQALMVLRASDSILERNLVIIRRNLVLLEAFVADYAEFFEWVRPSAGAVAFLKFKGPRTSEELGQELASSGISIKPAYCFTDRVTEENDFFRVGYGEETIPQALEALRAFVEERQATWRQDS
jgi:aspartate/methionine/tyrosine aminotransferase